MVVTPQVKAAVDKVLDAWGTNVKGSGQRVIRDYTDVADGVPEDVSRASDQERLGYAMKVLEGFEKASPFFSKKAFGSWESAVLPFTQAYAPASKIYSEWQPDYVQTDEGGVPSQGPVDYSRWAQVAPQLGFSGQMFEAAYDSEGGAMQGGPTRALQQFVDQKRAEGYDFVSKRSNLHNYNNYTGFKLPSGEVVGQNKYGDDDDIKSFFTDFVLPAAGAAFTMGGGLNALMGGGAAAAPANALTGAGLGAMEGVGLSGNIINAATGQTIASLPTAAMTAADIGRGLGDVLGQVSQPPALETANFAPLENSLVNVTTPAAQLTDAANAMQLSPVTQLQPITFAGEPYLTAGAGAGSGAGAGAAGLSAEALDAALAGAGGGAAGGKTALEALGGSLQAGTTPGALGSAMGSTTAALATGAGAGATGIPFLDKAIDFVTSPAGAAIVSGVGNVVGGIAGANAAENAAETQAGAADRATALTEKAYQDYLDMTKPYREAGVNALGKLTRGEILPEPGYAFRLGEGMKALERVQAARGNMLSGGALKAGQRYAQDLASQEYGNAYNRLTNIAGLGQAATTNAGTAGQNYASQAGELGLPRGNALAQGRIGRVSSYGNALAGVAGAVGDYTRGRQQEQLFRDIFGRVGG